MSKRLGVLGAIGLAIVILGAVTAFAQPKARQHEEKERKVSEAEVPAAALAAIKKAAGGAKLNQIEEEIEDGNKFYEGQWTGVDGKIEALVTESGDLVEIEEIVPAEKVPASVRSGAEKDAGKSAKLVFEKKTSITYEVHFKKDGRHHEAVFTPTGSQVKEEGNNGQGDDNDDE